MREEKRTEEKGREGKRKEGKGGRGNHAGGCAEFGVRGRAGSGERPWCECDEREANGGARKNKCECESNHTLCGLLTDGPKLKRLWR